MCTGLVGRVSTVLKVARACPKLRGNLCLPLRGMGFVLGHVCDATMAAVALVDSGATHCFCI